MLVSLDTAYADTAAGDLSFTLSLPRLPALYSLALPDPGVSLHLLGASHQVVLDDRIETVACLPDGPAHLPERAEVDGLRFAAEVRRPGAAALSAEVAIVRRMVAADPYGLVGAFPGHPDAITALQVTRRAGRVGWRTWHAYPQTGELVLTRTEIG
ncbi:hypothetical protein GCM10010123_27650 [Pilimelia anulata]|uniref:DUF2617 family protein n=1 Tax=Pilimelia anulata TaxID=53371 RepID=A0A8J3FBF9_9ACTN|nr:DUF2617 family protein [Pilimelia anulata]GGJ96149.1 hypothetical protein GCM10010123_27650 [Pilimelia anulata]